MTGPARASIGEVIRFLGVGGANTLVTGLLFLTLSYLIPQPIAYTVAFAVGIVFSTAVTPRLVFREQASVAKRAHFGAWYVVVYVVGLGLVFVFRKQLGFEPWIVVLVTAVATSGLSYLGARRIFDSGNRAGVPTGP